MSWAERQVPASTLSWRTRAPGSPTAAMFALMISTARASDSTSSTLSAPAPRGGPQARPRQRPRTGRPRAGQRAELRQDRAEQALPRAVACGPGRTAARHCQPLSVPRGRSLVSWPQCVRCRAVRCGAVRAVPVTPIEEVGAAVAEEVVDRVLERRGGLPARDPRSPAVTPPAARPRSGPRPQAGRSSLRLLRRPACADHEHVALTTQLQVERGQLEPVGGRRDGLEPGAGRRSASASVTSRHSPGSPPRPTRPRSWCSCEIPNRSASITTIMVASGTSTPTSMTVVATSTSIPSAPLRSAKRRITSSLSSPGEPSVKDPDAHPDEVRGRQRLREGEHGCLLAEADPLSPPLDSDASRSSGSSAHSACRRRQPIGSRRCAGTPRRRRPAATSSRTRCHTRAM